MIRLLKVDKEREREMSGQREKEKERRDEGLYDVSKYKCKEYIHDNKRCIYLVLLFFIFDNKLFSLMYSIITQ